MNNLIANKHAVLNASNSHYHPPFKHISNTKLSDKQPENNLHSNYTGTCEACGSKNHHATNFYFLQKIEVVIKFLAEQPSTTKGLHKDYHGRNNPKIVLAKSLQDAEFIPDTYKAYDPAVFVDAMWNDVPAFITDIPEDLITPNE